MRIVIELSFEKFKFLCRRFKFLLLLLLSLLLIVFVVFFSFFIKGMINLYPQFKNCPNIVMVDSGMANQMFYYAFGRALEEETGKDVCYDFSWYHSRDKKNLQKHEVDNAMVNFNIGDTKKKIVYNLSKYSNRIARKFLVKYYHYKQKRVPNFFVHYDGKIFEKAKKNNRNMFVLYSRPFNYNYFEKYNNKVFKDFELKIPLNKKNEEMLKEIKKHKNSVSIHIRRGDYLNDGHNKVITIKNYYNKALKFFENMDDVHYFIFSDDIEYAKKHLKTGKPTTYVDINDFSKGYFDLELMKNCKHNIIANSTFSWWGAYLNQNPNKIVVAPQVFMLGATLTFFPYPEDWKIIENIPICRAV